MRTKIIKLFFLAWEDSALFQTKNFLISDLSSNKPFYCSNLKLFTKDYKTPQVIISSYPIDETYKLEEVLFNSWKRLEKIISKTSDTNVNQVLSQLCVKSKTDHETVQLGLLYRLLTDVEAGPTCYRDISTTCRDNFQSVFKALCSLVSEKFFKMAPVALQQLFWFTNESLKNSLNGIFCPCKIFGWDLRIFPC